MFKKLKEKITEEVKSSPQRFQQLTQSVSDRLQNSSTSDENFFSIGEDDATPNSSFESGFTSVSLTSPQEPKMRRNSNSSVSSDVSFLPRYESVANMYHLQSDLDISASEIEDNASTSSQLGHLTKEQIYTAFQKAQMRYHKYRGRYTDLAKHYKDLERENSKMKAVLVDTQDKAIRRVTELKEQCALEQKAKAHLESALRDDIDEKQFKIQTLQTKIELLQNGGNPPESDNLDTLNKYLVEARQEIETLNQKIQEMKANSIIFQTKEQEYKTKISNLEKEISVLSEREKENSLSLAQNKMELHNELLSKDTEISNLKKSLEMLSGNGKFENLQSQNTKLIEKVEILTQKCNNYENELLKMEQLRIELKNATESNTQLRKQLEESEEKLQAVREDAKKSLLSLETKVREKLSLEFEEKEEQVKNEYRKKFEEVSSNANNLQEIQMSLMEKDEDIRKLKEVNEGILEQLTSQVSKYEDLEKNHLELIEENGGLRSKIGNLEKDLATVQNLNQAANLKMGHLETNVKTLEKTVEEYKQHEEKLDEEKMNLEESKNILEQEKKIIEDELDKERKINQELNDERKKGIQLEEFKARVLDLEQERETFEKKLGELLQKLEEKKNVEEKLQEERRINEKLNLKLHHLKTNVEEETKNLESKLEEERRKLLEKLEESERTVKNLEETSLSLAEELRLLKVENEEIHILKTELGKINEERKTLKEMEQEKDDLLNKLKKSEDRTKQVEEEIRNLCANLEDERKKNLILQSGEERESILKQQLDEKNEELKQLISQLQEKKSKVKGLEDSIEELKRLGDEKNHILELLEEANINLSIKEQKLSDYEEELKHKSGQIEALEKKLVEYNDLIEERIEGFFKVLTNFSQEPINNFKRNKDNKNLLNLEQKLQNFEQTFLLEKENLAKILIYLKQFEEKHNLVTSEKSQLEEEKEEMLVQIHDLQNQLREINSARTCLKQAEEELVRLKEENLQLTEDQEKMKQSILELESRNTQVASDSNFLSEENHALMTQIEELKLRNEDIETKYKNTELLINTLKNDVTRLEKELADNCTQKQLVELERHLSELQHEKQLLLEEIDELKTTPINLHNKSETEENKEEEYVKEIENLRTKIVQYKSLDLTNRSSIEFYENELQKLKNQNEKLNRKLDETLVTLNHCSELSNSTEIEYLKNVLYNYMLGKESVVLARVIAAVCKFDPQQTELILAKEQQKQTLLGQLGIL